MSLDGAHGTPRCRRGRVEPLLVERVHRLGRPAAFREVLEWCRQYDIKPATALMFLRTSPSFIRVLRGFYRLRGRPWLAFFVTRSWRAGGSFQCRRRSRR